MKTYLEIKENALILKLYIQPKASKNSFKGLYGDPLRLKVTIKAPPVEGAANKELIKFIAKTLNISKSSINLIRGESSRHKELFIESSGQQQYEIVRIINNLVK